MGAERKRPVVLVADDDECIRDLITLLLRDDYEVLTASDGQEALEIARVERPDVALLDISMPGYEGTEVLRMLREREEDAGIRAIFLSAQDADEQTDGERFVRKPFRVRELLEAVEACLN